MCTGRKLVESQTGGNIAFHVESFNNYLCKLISYWNNKQFSFRTNSWLFSFVIRVRRVYNYISLSYWVLSFWRAYDIVNLLNKGGFCHLLLFCSIPDLLKGQLLDYWQLKRASLLWESIYRVWKFIQ